MRKGPIYAIIFSIIALLSIYIFTDIKEKKSSANIEKVSADTTLSEISAFNKTLNKENLSRLNQLYDEAKNKGNKEAADELIKFYEEQQQFDFAAYYHSLKAELFNDSKNWEIAGDRQLSVSSNEAYDPTFNTKLYEQSLVSYQNALELDPENLDLQVKLGSAIVDRSPQPMQGITLLLGVIEKDSMHVNANLALGKFGIISKQYDKAVIRLEKVLSLQPENTEALFLAAEAYGNMGNKEKAITCLQKCKELIENEDLKKEIDAYMQQLL
ncbi:MAG: tetratricopeptide repeat protein [Candidatus Paceibacterota bacterium]